MVQDSPMLCDQIKSLSSSVNHLQRRLVKAEGRSLSKRVNALPPLPRSVSSPLFSHFIVEKHKKENIDFCQIWFLQINKEKH